MTDANANMQAQPARQTLRPARPLISIIAPCFNEADSVDIFVETMTRTLSDEDFDSELLFIDDGSTDSTREKLVALADQHPHIQVVILSRNFGKEAALTAGLDHAKGDAIVVMDVDLQDPPDLICQFVVKWREGFDVVYATREDRQTDTFAKRFTAEGFYRLFNRISAIKIPENTGDYRLMDRRVVETLKTLPERSRFMKGLFAWVGFHATGVSYVRPARAAGETKFNFWRLWNFALDGFVSFSTVPLRMWTYFGGFIAFLSFVYAAIIVFQALIIGRDVPGYASMMTLILFFGSVQIISVGVLGEYISRLFVEVKRRPIYIVDELYSSETGDAGASSAEAAE